MSDVVVTTSDGIAGTVPAEQVKDIQASGGRVLTAPEAKEAKREADLKTKYQSGGLGEVEGTVAPMLAGAARGLSFGGSDYLAAKSSEGLRRKLLEYQEFDPRGSAFGEVAGIAGGALVGSEGGLATLPSLVSKLGAGAERAAMRGLGEGVVGRVAGGALRGSVEGALYAEGKALSDASLKDEALTAEKLISSGLHGAKFGAGVGAGFGLLGAGVSKLVSGRQVGESASPSLREAAEAGAPAGAQDRLGTLLRDKSDEYTMKALGATPGDVRALERTVSGGVKRVAGDIRADVETTTGKSIGLHTRESLHEYATNRGAQLAEEKLAMLRKLDKQGAGIAPDVNAYVRRIEDEIIKPRTNILPNGKTVVAPGEQDAVRAAKGWVNEIKTSYGEQAPTFEQWFDARTALQKKINYASRTGNPRADTFKKMRAMAEDELEAAGEKAASQVGESFADAYRANKSLNQSMIKAAEITERGVSAGVTGNAISLRSMLGGASGLMTGGGGIIGGIPGAILGGVAGKLSSSIRADMMAADLLSRAANITGVRTAVARANSKIASGVSGLTGAGETAASKAPAAAGRGFISELLEGAGGATKAGVAAGSAQRRSFNVRSAAVAALSSNPGLLTERVGQMLGPVAEASPGVANAATAKIMGDLQFLRSKLPPTRRDPYSLQPQFQPSSHASDSEIAKHTRYVEALDNPSIILTKAKDGSLTTEHVEAVKERYPRIYQEIQTEVYKGLATSKSEVPYGRRIQLGILLGIPTDKTLSPEFVAAMQSTYETPPAHQPTPTTMSGLDLSDSLMTGTQSATQR